MSGVFEQDDWCLPIDSVAGKMISGYLAFYRAVNAANALLDLSAVAH